MQLKSKYQQHQQPQQHKDMSDKKTDKTYQQKYNNANKLINLSIQEKQYLKRQGISLNTLHDLQSKQIHQSIAASNENNVHNTQHGFARNSNVPQVFGSQLPQNYNVHPQPQIQHTHITPQHIPQKALNIGSLANDQFSQFNTKKLQGRHISVPKGQIIFQNTQNSQQQAQAQQQRQQQAAQQFNQERFQHAQLTNQGVNTQGNFQIKKTQNLSANNTTALQSSQTNLLNTKMESSTPSFSPLLLYQQGGNVTANQGNTVVGGPTNAQAVTLQAQNQNNKGQLKKANRILVKQTVPQAQQQQQVFLLSNQLSIGPNLNIKSSKGENPHVPGTSSSQLHWIGGQQQLQQPLSDERGKGASQAGKKLPLKHMQIGKNQGNFAHHQQTQNGIYKAGSGLAHTIKDLQEGGEKSLIVPSEFISANGLNLPVIALNQQQQNIVLDPNHTKPNISDRNYPFQQLQSQTSQIKQQTNFAVPKQSQSAQHHAHNPNIKAQNNAQFKNNHQVLIPTTNLIHQHKISQQQLLHNHNQSTLSGTTQSQMGSQPRGGPNNSMITPHQLQQTQQASQMTKIGILGALIQSNIRNGNGGEGSLTEYQRFNKQYGYPNSVQPKTYEHGASAKSSANQQQRVQSSLFTTNSQLSFNQKNYIIDQVIATKQTHNSVVPQPTSHVTQQDPQYRLTSNQTAVHQNQNLSIISTPNPNIPNSRYHQVHSQEHQQQHHPDQYRYLIQGMQNPLTLQSLQDLPINIVEQLIKSKKIVQVESTPLPSAIHSHNINALGMSQQNYNIPHLDLMQNHGLVNEYGQQYSPYQPAISNTQVVPKKQPVDLYGNPINKNKQKIPFENAYVEDCYKFIIVPGNNSQLIRRVLEKRSWWIEIQAVHSLFNFKWQPVSRGIRYDRLVAKTQGGNPGTSTIGGVMSTAGGHNGHLGQGKGGGGGGTKQNKNQNTDGQNSNSTASKTFSSTSHLNCQYSDSTNATTTYGAGGGAHNNPASLTISDLNSRQLVNHLENHHLITEKYHLLLSLTKYCDLQKENVFDLMPVTFYVEMPDVNKETAYNAAMQPFIQYFTALEENRKVIQDVKKELETYNEKVLEMEKEQENEGNEPGSQNEDGVKIDKSTIEKDVGDESDEDTKNDVNQENNASFDDANSDGKNDLVLDKGKKKSAKDAAKEQKSLLSNVGGYSTLYKTPGKDNQKSTKFKQFNFEKRNFTKLTCPLSHFDGYNLWLLKPTHLNRGRGIHVFRELSTLHKLIREYCIGKDEESWKKRNKTNTEESVIGGASPGQIPAPNSGSAIKVEEGSVEITDNSPDQKGACPDSPEQMPIEPSKALTNSPDPKIKKFSPCKTSSKGNNSLNKIKHNTFVIQKYIERPLLICNRKFDIRVWVLVDQDHNLHFFKEGYIRTSGSEFSIDMENIDNAAVHLTNNSVQKQLDSYGKFEDGNMLSFKRFQQILDLEQPDCGVDIYRDMVPMMKANILKSIYSVRKSIDPERRQFCFELFGYDFILDEDFNTWLIEVNTNPCLEESSQLLKDLLPRMLEDMFKLTIDQIFPKNSLKRRRYNNISSSPIKIKNRKNSAFIGPGAAPDNRGILHQRTSFSSKGRKKKKSDKQENVQNTDDELFNQREQQDKTDEPSDIQKKEEAVVEGENTDPKESDGAKEESKNDPANEENNQEIVMDQEEIELEKERKAHKRIYPIEGHPDNVNMWEKMLNVEKIEKCPNSINSALLQNNRHRYSIVVQDRVFKIKKNDQYRNKKIKQQQLQQQLLQQQDPTKERQGNRNQDYESVVALAQDVLSRCDEVQRDIELNGSDDEDDRTNEYASGKFESTELLKTMKNNIKIKK